MESAEAVNSGEEVNCMLICSLHFYFQEMAFVIKLLLISCHLTFLFHSELNSSFKSGKRGC